MNKEELKEPTSIFEYYNFALESVSIGYLDHNTKAHFIAKSFIQNALFPVDKNGK